MATLLAGGGIAAAAEPEPSEGVEPGEATDDTDEGADDAGAPGDDTPEVIVLTPPEDLPPSALQDLDGPDAATRADLDALIGEALGTGPARLPIRSQLILRPRTTTLLGLTDGPVQVGQALGASLGQRWWPLSEGTVRWSGENRLDLDGVVGRVRGWRATATASVGPWIGPVGLRVGLRADAGSQRSGEARLPVALLAGPEAGLGLEAGPLHPWVAFAPQWRLAGDRAKADDLPGTEWRATAGLAVETRSLWPRVGVEVHRAAAATLVSIQLGVSFRPSFEPPDPDDEVAE